MSNIAQVSIKGFQSHINSTFQLAPGLTVITGPSDAGKTAVIRALRWVAFNEPQGESFLFTLRDPDTQEIVKQAEVAEVTVEFENGLTITKTRRKGKTSYRHSEFTEPWEKAEVPQEIKEALGLYKQTYGENFETYLNFSYQLEAPFILSETPSVGAKILGKLAGTEVVDKAIAAISKNTHKTREEVRQADKSINEINVDLLDYMDVDSRKKQVEACEALLVIIEANAKRSELLTLYYSNYSTAVREVEAVDKKLEALAEVPNLVKELATTESKLQKYENLTRLQKLLNQYVGIIKGCETEIEKYNNLAEASILLGATENSFQRFDTLEELEADYFNNNSWVRNLEMLLERYKKIGEAAVLLVTVEKSNNRLANISHLINLFNSYSQTIISTSATLDKTKHADEVAVSIRTLDTCINKVTDFGLLLSKYSAFNAIATVKQTFLKSFTKVGEASEVLEKTVKAEERLAQLQQLRTLYSTQVDQVKHRILDLTMDAIHLEEAQKELIEAWEVAGGICPTCNQPVNKEAIA